MSPYESGVHTETEAGAIDLGVFVTEAGLGFALDAPVIGELRASFDVLADGSTKLTALSRQGVPVLGLTNQARIVELETELEARMRELAKATARIKDVLRGELDPFIAAWMDKGREGGTAPDAPA